MTDSSLLNLIKTFNSGDWRMADRFVRSPAHNQREDVIRLFDCLHDLRPFQNERALQSESIFKKVFPGQGYDEKLLRYTRSFLYQTLQDMLAWQSFKNEVAAAERYTAQAFHARGLEKAFEQRLRDAELALRQSPVRNIAFFYHQYTLCAERYAYENNKNRRSSARFQEYSDALSTFFMAERLRQSCTALSHKVMMETDFKQDFLPEILALVEAKDYSHIPAIMVYYHSYKALSLEEGATHFYELKSLISQHASLFPAAERRDIYLLAINYCIRQANRGKQNFLNEALELYQSGLQREAFMENGHLSRYTYTNIALAGIGLKKFDWTEQFIHDYREKVEPRFRDSAFHYNLALLYFRKPDYNKALELLRHAEFKDVLHNLDARRMLLRIYYDLEESEALLSLLDSFSIFLKRQKGLGYHREHYKNLLMFTRKLLQIKMENRKTKQALLADIERTDQVAEKQWLLEQLNKMMKTGPI